MKLGAQLGERATGLAPDRADGVPEDPGDLGEPRLTGLGAELAAIGDQWEEAAAAFAAAAQAENPAGLLQTATKPMRDIADREQDFWERLHTVIAA